MKIKTTRTFELSSSELIAAFMSYLRETNRMVDGDIGSFSVELFADSAVFTWKSDSSDELKHEQEWEPGQ